MRSPGASKRPWRPAARCSPPRRPAPSRPTWSPPAAQGDWRIELPDWCRDQRNQMTGPGRRRRARRQDAQLGRARGDARPGRLDGQHVAERPAGRRQHGRGVARRADLRRKKAATRRSASSPSGTVAVDAACAGCTSRRPACTPKPTSASLFDLALLAYKVDLAKLGIRSRSTFRSPIGRRRAVVARRVPGHRRARGWTRTRSSAWRWWRRTARVPDRGVPLQPARPHPGLEPGPLGLHGEPDPLQPGRSRLGAAGPQHDPARRGVLPEPARADARDLPQAAVCSRSAA